jgi:hypothetical protein
MTCREGPPPGAKDLPDINDLKAWYEGLSPHAQITVIRRVGMPLHFGD